MSKYSTDFKLDVLDSAYGSALSGLSELGYVIDTIIDDVSEEPKIVVTKTPKYMPSIEFYDINEDIDDNEEEHIYDFRAIVKMPGGSIDTYAQLDYDDSISYIFDQYAKLGKLLTRINKAYYCYGDYED